MKKISSAFENFVFKSFDFSGRATLVEYWVVMPVIWTAILFLAWGDAHELWGMLLERRVPPMNPLYWDGLLLFVVTIIPRLSLTVRRLHDSNKNGKWAKLPFISLISGFWLAVGLGTALITMNATRGDLGDELGMFALAMALTVGSADTAWDAIFSAAAVINSIGWDAIIALMAEMMSPAQNVDLGAGLSNIASDFQKDPALTSSMSMVMLILIATPFVAAMLHLFFMTSPGVPEEDRPGSFKVSGASLRQIGEVSENPFDGYKYLYERSPEQEAAKKAADKEAIRSLYQQRVLGKQPS